MKRIFVIIAASFFVLSSCSSDKKEEKGDKDKMGNSAEAQEEKNKATALASVNALIAGDYEAAVKDGPADGNVTDYGDGSMPAVKGADSIKAMLKMWRGSLSEYKADNMWAIADGDYVAVFGDWTMTFNTDFMGMKTNGKTVKIKDVDIFKFNSDGKIIEHRNVQSSAAMMSQLGGEMPK
jgi:predicted ester cyclase